MLRWSVKELRFISSRQGKKRRKVRKMRKREREKESEEKEYWADLEKSREANRDEANGYGRWEMGFALGLTLLR